MSKKEITEAEFNRIVLKHGGFEKLTVFGAHTAIEGDQFTPDGDFYTEWGLEGDDEPLVICSRRGFYPNKENEVHEHYKVVKPK